MNHPLRPSDFIAPAKIAAAMRARSREQDALDTACGWPEIETAARHAEEQRALDESKYEEDDYDLDLVAASDWEGMPVPERKWIVPGWIPSGAVTSVAGKGGAGKSLAVQQWLSAISVGAEFMGLRSACPMPVMYVNCEDTQDELHRRQVAIANAMGRSLGGFSSNMLLAPRVGLENALGTITDRGKFAPSELFNAIQFNAIRMGIKVVALDNAMQHFVGNPNDNGEVTRFLNALTALALAIDGAVVLVAHTAKADGSEFMGCMAWENGVRCRLYMTRETDDDGKEIIGSDRRILSRNKANMAGIGERIEMEWQGGAFVPAIQTGDDGADAQHEAAFLRCLDEATAAKRNVSHTPSVNYAPKVFAAMQAANKASKRNLERAMQRLFDKGQIVANSYLWNDEGRRPKSGIKRAESCPNRRPNPRPHTMPEPPEPLGPNPPAHSLYTTYISGAGPDGPPPLTDDEYLAILEADAAIAEAMGWEERP